MNNINKKIHLLGTLFCLFLHQLIDAENACRLSNENLVMLRRKIIGQQDSDQRLFCKDYKKISLSWPVDNCDFWISSLFGLRKHKGVFKKHRGVDLAAISGTLVKVAAPGKVLRADYNGATYGNYIDVLHKNGWVTRYGHLQEMYVSAGDRVERGEEIGVVGATGHVRGKRDPSHLHFELIDPKNQHVDPTPYLFCTELDS